VFAAALWVGAEALRARFPFGGFPWGKVAFGQPEGLYLPLAAVGGAPLVSFAVALTGLALADMARRIQLGEWRLLAASGVMVLVPPLLGLQLAGWMDAAPQAGTLTVALVQGNVPQAGLDFNAQRRAVLDNHRHRTEQLAADVRSGPLPRPDLVLWPENAADIDPLRNPDAAAAIDAAATAIGAPILLGAILDPPDGPFNAVLQWEPGVGATGQYIKRHVQPFGEYIPLRPLARLVSPDVERVSRPIQPGDRVGVMDLADTTVAVATCYEVAFDYVVTDAVRAGGTLLAVPTNNATFGFTEMSYQQLAMSRVRAVEHSRAVLVAATSGVSAVIASDGTVQQRTELFTPDALVAQVPLRTATTLATRMGSTPEWLLVAVGIGALVVVWSAGRRRRAARRTQQPDTSAEDM
jgi:apolipoprotein N-acyltransferase